jgi:hypothetical protein
MEGQGGVLKEPFFCCAWLGVAVFSREASLDGEQAPKMVERPDCLSVAHTFTAFQTHQSIDWIETENVQSG